MNGSLYPFGFGLSYTRFEYSDLRVTAPESGIGDILVSCDVTNVGRRAGDEVVQLYVSDLVASLTTYESQLRGFERVTLAPGETRTVTFSVKPEDLQMLDIDMDWVVEPGDFEIRIGASSEDIRLRKTITLDANLSMSTADGGAASATQNFSVPK